MGCDEWELYLAWYLFDPGVSTATEKCGCCQLSEDHDLVFRECVVPQDSAAGGACTNCLFRFEGAGCSHRIEARRILWTPAQLAAMSEGDLKGWKRRFLLDLYDRAMGGGPGAERSGEILRKRGLI